MDNKKKALIIVHANGQYDKENKVHRIMVGAIVNEDFYVTLVEEIESGKYDEILYKI